MQADKTYWIFQLQENELDACTSLQCIIDNTGYQRNKFLLCQESQQRIVVMKKESERLSQEINQIDTNKLGKLCLYVGFQWNPSYSEILHYECITTILI